MSDYDRNSEQDRNQENTRNREQDLGRMDNDELEQQWIDINESYRRRYSELTDEDTLYNEGEFDNMLNRIARRTDRSVREVRNEIENWDYDDTEEFDNEYESDDEQQREGNY
jgi:hypothetical protein